MRFLVPILLPLTGLLVLSHPTNTPQSYRPQIRWIDCRDQVPFTFDSAGIDLDKLPLTLHCGEIIVPMDYAQPLDAQNNITVALAMYRPEKKSVGVIFYNPGGTDEATIFAWQTAFNQTEQFSGLTNYDLMMMDVRGTYHSNPLNVSLDVFKRLQGPYPTTQIEFDSVKNASAEAFRSWADSSYPPGILEYVGTKEVVQDLESIRRALCYDKINFIGASYGSFRAAQYASEYPERVGNFVLDAVVPHGISIFDQAQHQIAAANRGLLRADTYCQNNSSCPFRIDGRGSVVKAYRKVLEAAEIAPLPASLCVNSTSCITPVTMSNIQTSMQNLLFGQPDFPAIFQALEAALQGDASLFAMAALVPFPGVPVVWSMPLLCSDYDIGDNTFGAFERSLKAGSEGDTSMLGKAQAWQLQLFCSGRSFSTPASKPLTLTKPMLLVTADFDVSAPTEWTRAIWEQNPKSGLVIRHGDDHVSILLPNASSSVISKEFIRSGKLPTARNEQLVSVYAPGTKIGPIANPYDVPTGIVAGDVDSDSR